MGFALVVLVGGSAVAAPLKIRNGSAVRVALQGKRELGVGLRPSSGGWRLELATSPGEVADVFDVTDGGSGNKWTVEAVDGALLFDEERFIAGHAYRVLLRRGGTALGTTLVYLYPPSAATRHRVTFDDADSASGVGQDIAITKKPTL